MREGIGNGSVMLRAKQCEVQPPCCDKRSPIGTCKARAISCAMRCTAGASLRSWSQRKGSYLVDPASSHMLVSKIKLCMHKYERSSL